MTKDEYKELCNTGDVLIEVEGLGIMKSREFSKLTDPQWNISPDSYNKRIKKIEDEYNKAFEQAKIKFEKDLLIYNESMTEFNKMLSTVQTDKERDKLLVKQPISPIFPNSPIQKIQIESQLIIDEYLSTRKHLNQDYEKYQKLKVKKFTKHELEIVNGNIQLKKES